MRADRLLKLMMLLQAQGKMTAQALAKELEVSRRTILRDVDALSFAGVPVYTDGGHGGGISLDKHYRVKLNGLKESEVQALMVSMNTSLLRDIGLGEAAETSLLKLFSELPSLHEQAAKEIMSRIYIDPAWWWHGHQNLTYLSDLQRATLENRVIDMAYLKHDGGEIERTVNPYGLVSKAGVWYLVAERDGEYRSYRVSRIKYLLVRDESFERDSAFDLAAYWKSSVDEFLQDLTQYTCTLRIPDEKTNFVKWYTPGSYEVIQTSDQGWFVARFELESVEIATMLVVGLGPQTEVLDPPELRENVLRQVQSVLQGMSQQTP
ncbi:MAG: YafY family transcriptional regulator [Anaerolineae bacterium]|nr:YafY family transcriptional regulator [Anaerolineae bacterium]